MAETAASSLACSISTGLKDISGDFLLKK